MYLIDISIYGFKKRIEKEIFAFGKSTPTFLYIMFITKLGNKNSNFKYRCPIF